MLLFSFLFLFIATPGQSSPCPREWGKSWRKKILKLVTAADHYASVKKSGKMLRLQDNCMPMMSNYQCSQLNSPNKKKCEVIIWNNPKKPYVGSLTTTARHNKKPAEVCTLQFNMKDRTIQRSTFTNSCFNVTYKFWTEWSEWSDCPKPCGQVGETRESRARRTRSCHDGYAQGDVSLKSFLGLCEETLQVTHSDCQNTICPTSFFFSLNKNEKPESYPFSTVNPQSKKECDEFVFIVLRNGSEIELTDEQCKRMVDAINNSIREINEERENSSSEILGRRSRTLTQSFSPVPKLVSNAVFNESSSVKGESRVDFLERQLREQEEKIRAFQIKIDVECSRMINAV